MLRSQLGLLFTFGKTLVRLCETIQKLQMKTKYFVLLTTTSMLVVGINLLFIEAVQAGPERRLIKLMVRLIVRSTVHPSLWFLGFCVTLLAGFLVTQKIK